MPLLLSNAAIFVLRRMKAAEDDDNLDDAEIVVEGRTCYIGLRLISKATVNELLRLCLIQDDSDQNGKLERYTINEEGRAILSNPTYKPQILAALKKRKVTK